ncbi:MAG: EF-P lysine aminoacylase EpmA [Woeseiaceae bacterium]
MTHWQPTSGPQTAASRAAMLRRIRAHFDQAALLEVDTPALSPFAVSDTQLESLEIQRSAVSSRPLYLHTSPEFCLKRLLAAGYPDIYSICRVFRDGESGKQHQPEFTLIEWYRLNFTLQAIIDDTVAVIRAALAAAAPPALQLFEYRALFVDALGVDPLAAPIATLAAAADADATLRAAIGSARDDWLDLLLATRIAPTFSTKTLTVVRHYPASQAALARLCPADTKVADRFEIFLGPVELANGYVELTDAQEQRQRIEADNENRRRRQRRERPVDSALLAALEHGLPACAGVAMGLERLQMLHDKTDDIRDVITFAFEADA